MERDGKDDGQQQQSDARHHHDEPQLPDDRLASLTSLRPLISTSSSRRSEAWWICRQLLHVTYIVIRLKMA